MHTAEIAEQTTPDELADLVVNKSIEFLDKLLSDKEEDSDPDEEKFAEFLKMFH